MRYIYASLHIYTDMRTLILGKRAGNMAHLINSLLNSASGFIKRSARENFSKELKLMCKIIRSERSLSVLISLEPVVGLLGNFKRDLSEYA